MTQSLRDALGADLNCTPGLTFAKDIAPLFNATDIEHMKSVTSGSLDLSSCESVTTWAHAIYEKVSTGEMPPPPADPWTSDMIQTFACWVQQGCVCGD